MDKANQVSSVPASYRDAMIGALQQLDIEKVNAIASVLFSALKECKQIFVIGNGGSAATASHMMCDFAKTTLGKSHEQIKHRVRAIALSDNAPLITAWGNDVGYDVVFAEQLRNFANKGDVLISISASGNSPNVLKALEAAKELGLTNICLLGFSGGKALSLADHAIVIDSSNYGVIEDMHGILNHMLTTMLRHHVDPNFSG